MTKTLSQLAKLKLEVINYHNHDMSNPDSKTGGNVVNEQFLVSLARDACYTSHNSLQFKQKQVADSVAEYDQAMEENNVYAAERTGRWIDRLAPELDELEVRHKADLEVYCCITNGDIWEPKQRTVTKAKKRDFSALKKRVA